jgi:N4-gp56 family major capsid protein
MSFSGTQYGDISPRVGIYAVGRGLERARNQLVLENFAMQQAIPKNKSQTIKWRRLVPLALDPQQIAEGVTPAPSQMEQEIITGNIYQYGAWMAFSDVVQDTHEDPLLNDMVDLLGEKAGGDKEMIIWGVIKAGSNVVYAGSATSRATVASVLTLDDVRAVVRELNGNHAPKLTKAIMASDRVSTQGVPPAYVAFCHTNLEADLKDMAGFTPVEQYAGGSLIHPNEIGRADSVRFIATPHLEPFYGAGSTSVSGLLNNGTNVDVYPIVVVAANAYGTLSLAGKDSTAVTVVNPKVTSEDPMGQRGVMSYKFWYNAVRLNENWMVRIETAARAL